MADWLTRLSLIVLIPICSQAQTVTRKSKIYEIGKTNGPPLFFQTSKYEKLSSGKMKAYTEILDSKQKPVAAETAIYSGSRIETQKFEHHQANKTYELRLDNERAYFLTRLLEGKGRIKENHDYAKSHFITGPVIEPFLKEKWSDLLAGKTVSCDFGVLELQEIVGFKFAMKGRTKVNGKEVIQIEMKPSSFIISIAVDPIQLYLDPKEVLFVKIVGRTPLLFERDGDLEPLEAEVIFE